MQRKHFVWTSMAFMGLSACSAVAQDGVWKPVTQHQARYESADTRGISLLGKPIAGRSRVDQAIEPAGFAPDLRNTSPLPPAPPTKPLEQEALPYPKTTINYPQGGMPAGAVPTASNIPVNAYPAGTIIYPNGSVVYPNANGAALVPQPTTTVVSNGQGIGTPVMGNPYTMDGSAGIDMTASDRYYRQAIHGSPGLWYGSIDYLALQLSHDNSPSLLITGTQVSTGTTPPGFNVTSTTNLFGDPLPSNTLYGGRVMMGMWFNRCQTWGIFGSFFTTASSNTTFSAASADGTTFLARPFFNTSPDVPAGVDREQFERVSDFGGIGGGVTIDRSLIMRSADLNFRFNWWHNVPTCGKIQWNVDSYFGVKYMGLDESLQITENLQTYKDTVGAPVTLAGTTTFVQDTFSTKNNFIGGNLGLLSELRMGRFFVEVRTGLAIGANQQEVTINGVTQYHLPNLPVSPLQQGGLLAQQTNIGTYNRAAFSLIPDLGVKLGLQVTDHVRVYAGYELQYWTNVVRPGQQIDRNVNTTQLPSVNAQGVPDTGPLRGSATPAFNFNNSNLLINGLSAGLSWVF